MIKRLRGIMNKKNLLNSFSNLLYSNKNQINQINSVNLYLKEIVKEFSPYKVSVDRIKEIISINSKAN